MTHIAGDVLTDHAQTIDLPIGTLYVDKDGDPILRAGERLWLRATSCYIESGRLTWQTCDHVPSRDFAPYRIVAFAQPADLAPLDALRRCLPRTADLYKGKRLDVIAGRFGLERSGEGDDALRARLLLHVRAPGQVEAQAARPRFKVGDRVRIARKVEHEPGWADRWTSDMDRLIGREGEVTSIGQWGIALSCGCGYNWPPGALEPVDPVVQDAADALGLTRRPGETDDDLRKRVLEASRPPAADTAAAVLAALREVDPAATLEAGKDGDIGPGWVRATVAASADADKVAQALWGALPLTTETRGAHEGTARNAAGLPAMQVHFDRRPAVVGEEVPADLVPDRAVVRQRGGYYAIRWGDRGSLLNCPDKDGPEHVGRLCNPAVATNGWRWGGDSLVTVVAVNVPESALTDRVKMCRVLGWPLPSARVGDEVEIERIPLGAVAQLVGGKAGDIAQRRSVERPGVRYLALHCDEVEPFGRGWLAPADTDPRAEGKKWRILALDVPVDASPTAALRAAGVISGEVDDVWEAWRAAVSELGGDAWARLAADAHPSGDPTGDAQRLAWIEAEALALLGGCEVGGRLVVGAYADRPIARRLATERSAAWARRLVALLRGVGCGASRALSTLLGVYATGDAVRGYQWERPGVRVSIEPAPGGAWRSRVERSGPGGRVAGVSPTATLDGAVQAALGEVLRWARQHDRRDPARRPVEGLLVRDSDRGPAINYPGACPPGAVLAYYVSEGPAAPGTRARLLARAARAARLHRRPARVIVRGLDLLEIEVQP